MSPPRLAPFRSAGDRADISIRDAMLTWFGAYVVGAAAVQRRVRAQRRGHLGRPRPRLARRCVACAVDSDGGAPSGTSGKRFGVGNLSADFGLSFRPSI